MRSEGQGAEHRGESLVAHIQPAGEGAEGRHHHALTVGGKAAARDCATAMRHARDRVQMAGDLARNAARQMAEGQRADRQFGDKAAADIGGGFGIVIAGDPDPVAAALQGVQGAAVAVGKPRRTAAVMETVAQRHDDARRVVRDQPGEARQCGGAVVRRQQLPARGIARTLFQMHVGDGEQTLLGPIERAHGVGVDTDRSNFNVMAGLVPAISLRKARPCQRIGITGTRTFGPAR